MAGEIDYSDVLSGQPSAAPPPVPKQSGPDYTDLIAPNAAPSMAAVADVSPQNGAAALAASRASGLPTTAVIHDPETVNGMATTRNAVAIANTNPKMAQWSAGDPAHVAVTKDQYPWLDKFSRVWGEINKALFPGPRPQTTPWEEIKNEFSSSMEGLAQDWNKPLDDNTLVAGMQAGQTFINTPQRLLGAAFSPLTGFMTGGPGQQTENITGLNRDVTGTILSMLFPLGAKARPEILPPERNINLGPRPLPKPPSDIIDVEATDVAKPKELPHPAEVVAENNASVIDALHEATQSSEVQARSPETMQEFIRQQTENTPSQELTISPNAIMEAYQSQGMVVHPKDGLLGWMPDLQEQLQAAIVSGHDVRVPTDGYMTNVSDAGHTALRGGIAVGNMPSVDEAKDIAKTPIAPRLVVARKTTDGIIYGKYGAAHGDLFTDGIIPEDFDPDLGMGWAVPGGEFLTREQALKYVSANQPHVFAELGYNGNTPPPLESNDYEAIITQAKEKPIFETPTEETAQVEGPMQTAINRVKQEQYLNPLFKDAKAAGMTEGQFNAYSRAAEKFDAALHQHMFELAAKQIKKEATAEWKAKAAEVEPRVREEIGSRPNIQISHFLTNGELPDGSKPFAPVKLDRAAVAKAFPDLVNDLPRVIFGPNGVGADDLAEAFGFRNGESMLRAIDDAERVRKMSESITGKKISVKDHFETLVKSGVRREVGKELGDLLSPENIEREATLATQRPEVQRLLTDELKVLTEAQGLPFHASDINAYAEDSFNRLNSVDATKIKSFEKLIGRYGREAEVALIKGDIPKALLAKQRQLINVKMLGLAHTFRAEFLSTAKQFKSLAKTTTSDSIPQEYMNYIHAILAKVGQRVSRSEEELYNALGGKSLETFAAEKNAEGSQIYTSPYKSISPAEMTVGELRDLRSMVNSLTVNGRNAQTILTHVGRVQLADQVNKAKDQFEDRDKKKSLEDVTSESKVRAGFQKAKGSVTALEFVTRDLDGANGIHGAYTQSVMRPMQDAFNVQSAELRAFAKHLMEFKPAPGFNKALDQGVTVNLPFTDVLGEQILPIKLKKNLLMAALHYGSETGRDKLLRGYGWGHEAEMELRAAFDKYLNADDIAWLNHLWAYGMKQWPKIEEFTRRVSGVAAEQTHASPFTISGQVAEGGYAPIVYSRELMPHAEMKSPGGSTDLFGPNYVRASTPRSYSKARTGYAGPIDLDPAAMQSHYIQQIHDYAMREAIVSAQKFLADKAVSSMMIKSVGKGYTSQFDPWLHRVAGQMQVNDGLQALSQLAELGRHLMISANLAYHVSTVIMHGTTAAAKSLQDAGAAGVGTALQKFLDDPKGFIEFGTSRSEFLKDRKVDRDETHQEQFARMTSNQGVVEPTIRAAQDLGFLILRMSDNVSAHMQWRAEYERAMADPTVDSEKDAIYLADQAVRLAHGSGREIDLPNLLGSKSPWVRAFTPFMTSRINSLNRVMWAKGMGVLASLFTTVGVSGLVYTALHREGKKSYLADLAENTVVEGLGYMPFLSALTYGVRTGEKVQSSTIDDMLQTWATLSGDIQKKYEHPNRRVPLVQDVMRAAGIVSGGVTGALARPAQYLWDLHTGYRHPTSALEVTHDLLFGPKSKGH